MINGRERLGGSLFVRICPWRVLGRGPKRELAEMKDELKKSRLSAFLETYWVPYVVDMGAAG